MRSSEKWPNIFKYLQLAAYSVAQKCYGSLLRTWELSFGQFQITYESVICSQVPFVNLASIKSEFNNFTHYVSKWSQFQKLAAFARS